MNTSNDNLASDTRYQFKCLLSADIDKLRGNCLSGCLSEVYENIDKLIMVSVSSIDFDEIFNRIQVDLLVTFL